MGQMIDVFRSLDTSLYYYLETYGTAIYVLLFLVIYCKTAFVILTFLPGDTTVFASGALAAIGKMDGWLLFIIFVAATVLGDSQNYLIGKWVGRMRLARNFFFVFISERTIAKAKNFLMDYGKVAITFSRFVPLMRTSIPFVAGYTGYAYRSFAGYNCMGGFIWTIVWLGSGFILGNCQLVEENLFVSLLVISCIAFIPAIIGFARQYKKKHPDAA